MDTPVAAPPGESDSAPAVLVVINGRLTGARRPLTESLTLLGRAPHCEMRLNVEGVQPLHAALVHGPDGFLLRDLSGDGVIVNGQTAAHCRVEHGDVIGVGPFQFRLERTAPSAQQTAEAEREALRVQAAAVAAQQAALTDEEMRLVQRRTALEKQEEQLAGHLETRRRRLREIQDKMRREREAFQAMRTAAVEEQAAVLKEAHAERDAAAAVHKQIQERRRRLMALRKRLRQREQRHWQAKEAELARREAGLAAREAKLRNDADVVRRGQASLAQARLRLNGELELGKRQLRDQWQELGLAQQQWEACLNQEHAERDKRGRELDARAAALGEAEHHWCGRERSVRLALVGLYRESEGLEARIANQRQKLALEEAAVARLRAERLTMEPAAATAPAAVLPMGAVEAPPDGARRTAVLDRIAGNLADQRAHLLEQWQTLVRVQDEWQRERETGLAELESVARTLHEREQRLLTREREADGVAAECRKRQQVLAQMRFSLEGWQARLRSREATWEAERAGLLTQVRAREEAAVGLLKRLQDLARRRQAQRAKEVEELAGARKRCEDLRQQYVVLWEECQRRRTELSREQRELAAQTLALEQARMELVGAAPDAAKAERRVERLRRRNLARIAAAEREVERARAALAGEAARLDGLARHVQQEQEGLTARSDEWTRVRTAWEAKRIAEEDADERRRLDAEMLYARHAQDAQVIARLSEELERTACLLMGEGEEAAPSAQAA